MKKYAGGNKEKEDDNTKMKKSIPHSAGKERDKNATKSSSRSSRSQEVQVVVASSGFPISSRPSKRKFAAHNHSNNNNNQSRSTRPQQQQPVVMDLHQAKKDVRHYGATAFVGSQKRSYENEQYQLLTGRRRPQPKMPPKLARERRKKAQQQYEKQVQQAKEAGLVSLLASATADNHHGKKKSNSQQRRDEYHKRRSVHGPAPTSNSVGIVKNGMLRLSKKPF